MKKLGLIINPIAGMGGSVGLKGTDGVWVEAARRGAMPLAGAKTLRALQELAALRETLTVLTCAGAMGEDVLKKTDLPYEVAYTPATSALSAQATAHCPFVGASAQAAGLGAEAEVEAKAPCPFTGASAQGGSAAADTRAAAIVIAAAADAIAFAGGDGTARDIYAAIGERLPALGIPAGVKIHSPVYAKSPEKAGELLRLFLNGQTTLTQEAEVLDIDEADYRRDIINTRLFGYLKVPYDRRLLQGGKAPSPMSEKTRQWAIAAALAEGMAPDTLYFVGPGSTTRTLMEYFEADNTLLGVDALLNGKTVARDMSEAEILQRMEGRPARLIVTPTGGQGYLLGRGNQQISPRVVKALGKQNIIVAATPDKLAGLRGDPLLVDTGDPEADALLRGYWRVVSGQREMIMYAVE